MKDKRDSVHRHVPGRETAQAGGSNYQYLPNTQVDLYIYDIPIASAPSHMLVTRRDRLTVSGGYQGCQVLQYFTGISTRFFFSFFGNTIQKMAGFMAFIKENVEIVEKKLVIY